MTRILFAVWFLLGISAAQAQSQTSAPQHCWNDKLSNTNGIRIRLQSGLTYQAYPGSQSVLSRWLPLDRLEVCRLGGSAVQMTDLNNQRGSVKALRIYPQ